MRVSGVAVSNLLMRVSRVEMSFVEAEESRSVVYDFVVSGPC
jgi:hypothetical protein